MNSNKPLSTKSSAASNKSNQLLFIQTVFSTTILIFCMYQIIMNKGNENLSLYWGGIMSILGYWFPSPVDSNK